MEAKETPEKCVCREVEEETGGYFKFTEEEVRKMGKIDFSYVNINHRNKTYGDVTIYFFFHILENKSVVAEIDNQIDLTNRGLNKEVEKLEEKERANYKEKDRIVMLDLDEFLGVLERHTSTKDLDEQSLNRYVKVLDSLFREYFPRVLTDPKTGDLLCSFGKNTEKREQELSKDHVRLEAWIMSILQRGYPKIKEAIQRLKEKYFR